MAFRRKGGKAVGISGTNYILSGLNERQQEAVTAPCRPTVVFAGPGSGKTTVLTRRILYLMEKGTSPGQIMVVTFTRAAAREMKSRLQEVNPVETDKLWIGTFHSLFLLMLQESGMRIPPLLKDGRQKETIRNILSQLNQSTDDDTIGTYLQQIGLCKAHAILPARMKVQKQKNILFREIYSLYEAWKRDQDCWDYDDILLAMYHQVKKPEFLARWQERLIHILVDEFQDINRIQYDILVRLASRHRLLYAVGDDDQSIYGFRGSDPEIMLQLKKDFPDLKRYILTTNYRSADPIIQASERLIQKNRFRQAKVRHGLGKDGADVEWMEPEDENEEAERILFRIQDGTDTAVLFRTATQARALVDALVRKGISFYMSGEFSFYRRWQIQDLFSYFRLAKDPDDLDALIRIINKPKRYLFQEKWIDACWSLSKKSGRSLVDTLPSLPGLEPYQVRHLDKLGKDLREIQSCSPVEAIRHLRFQTGYDRYLEAFAKETGAELEQLTEPLDELMVAAENFSDLPEMLAHAEKVEEALKQTNPDTAKIKLMTLHRSKGLEFDRVFIIGLQAQILPHHRSLQVAEERKSAAWEEERRLLYVGMTRARKELILSSAKTRQGKKAAPSPFLKDIGITGETRRAQGGTDKKPESASPVKPSDLKKQPQMRFIHEELSIGMQIHHTRFGTGIIEDVVPIEGVAPGRKILVRFQGQRQSLHYELSRQLGLILQA
jgi:DNA helicase II / ATP-dependent DNA helicase PcrA